MKFAFFIGCNIPARLEQFEFSSRAVLGKLGVELVDIREFNCCGYPLRNIDLKAFNNEFYKKNCKARLDPVLKTLKILKQENVWLEITNLIIPGENDDINEIKKMINWISEELGKDIPLHFSKFHPDYKMKDHNFTGLETLQRASAIGKKAGLHYVYMGNVPVHGDTYCPDCDELLIDRTGYTVAVNKLVEGHCPKCNREIEGVWK